MLNPRLTQFAANLHQEVLQRSGDNAVLQLREEAFTEYVLELLSEYNEADGADICYYEARSVGRVPAAKLNACSLSGDGATLDLFISLYRGTGEPEEVGLPETRRQFQLLRGFLRRVLDGFHTKMEEAGDAFLVAQKIHEAKESLTTVRVFFLTDGIVRSLDLEQEPLGELEIRPVVWDIDKLSRLRPGHREVIALDFENDYNGPIPCLQTRDATGEYRTFLAFFPGPLLAQIYGQHGQRLLERNVRAFLQAKGKVNKGLQKTLKDEPHRFLAYNNGLCCTAAEVVIEGGRDGHALLKSVKDFQVVNGGQTTASIYHALKKEKLNISNVVVQVKLTVLSDPSLIPQIVPLISRYANSQNKINGADFSANGIFHQQLEELSRTVWAPATSGLERGTHWYYERARGSYADDKSNAGKGVTGRAWLENHPQEQKFTKTELAKFEHAWCGMPHLVCQGAEKNFVKFAEHMEEDGDPLVDLNYFKLLVGKAILWRTAEKLFDALDLEGYRANSVAYAVAWIAEKSGRRLDLLGIWEKQRISIPLSDALKIVCKVAWDFLTSREGNVGEVSKRVECWQEFRGLNIELPDLWQQELLDNPVELPHSDEDALREKWESLRSNYSDDIRTMGQLEIITGKNWIPAKRRDKVQDYTCLTFDEIRSSHGLRLRKIRMLVEIIAAAAEIESSKWAEKSN